MSAAPAAILDRAGLDGLLAALQGQGYECIGPRLRDQAIVYDTLQDSGDLPIGWRDSQDGGHYRLERREDEALFGYAVGPQSWKKFLFPPRQTLFRARRQNGSFQFDPEPVAAPRRAFIGVRACELKAMAIQDRVFQGGPYADAAYQARREQVFIVALNCSYAGGTCFCVSMGTGPRAEGGFDLALTEVLESDRHYFTVQVGSERGEQLLAQLSAPAAGEGERQAAAAVVEATAASMGRAMDNRGIKQLLYDNLEHPRWQDVAERCLSCGNCTLVCPTCFCSTVEDHADLAGQEAVRERLWDSCFNQSFSYIAGGNVRGSVLSRYRQWMTHKLASWYDQFDSSGCVGCGRCITWCPVGIDITEEVHAIRAQQPDQQGAG